ncbi:Collagen alpha-1(XXVII) chain B [Takifugu flavidus]|uniref:Collagen alpha-1(XXVII) chain B n=1 Tax=Takifugu flavidus TaxID=433684 RepID=A0A5C6MZ08_9TELE|nr:Collagen alpha-1(XXVII) chain B [Takifugu flavidus]
MDCKAKMEVKALRESKEMMGKWAYLANQETRVKPVQQDILEFKASQDQRVRRVCQVTTVHQGKEAPSAQLGYQEIKEMLDLKDNQEILEKKGFQGCGVCLDQRYNEIFSQHIFSKANIPCVFLGAARRHRPSGYTGTKRTSWTDAVFLQGVEGALGPTGIIGPSGHPGAQGDRGSQGEMRNEALGSTFQVLDDSDPALRPQIMDLHLLDQGTAIFQTLQHISTMIQSLKNPVGTRENPARICRDLYNCEEKMNDGAYWIDPNLGCGADTIEVMCNFTGGGQTCLKPVTVSKMEIDVGRIQMNFIHLLSTEAVQHITIHCLNTPVWAEGASLQPSDKAVSFRAWTGERIQAGDLLEPLIPRDDCWMRDGHWHRTHFIFQTQDPNLLPIVEVYNLPTTEQGARYHLEVGPVCFL